MLTQGTTPRAISLDHGGATSVTTPFLAEVTPPLGTTKLNALGTPYPSHSWARIQERWQQSTRRPAR